MCGILGGFGESMTDINVFRSALNQLKHRGPDAEGISKFPNGFLGHRRLSVIDLSASADQPLLLNGQESLQISFNGEVYNYKELGEVWRQELKTKSDTEVVIKGYSELGIEFFRRLRGIYAFSIYDSRSAPKIILYRDPAGVKPLYYYVDGDLFVFGSELKALLPLINKDLGIERDLIKVYLSLGYCPEPYTVYKNVLALEPGFALIYDVSTRRIEKIELGSYHFCDEVNDSEETIREIVYGLLNQSVKRNIVADVPIKFALSGGIDSSLMVAIAQKQGLSPESLTISFEDREFSETETVKKYQQTLGLKSEFLTCKVDDTLPLLRRLLLHFDQPFADSSLVPFYFLAREASKSVKVLIGGDGGDEVQSGYPNFGRAPLIAGWQRYQSVVRLLASLTTGGLRRRLRKLSQLLSYRRESELFFLLESWIYPQMGVDGVLPFKFDHRVAIDFYETCFGLEGDCTFAQRFQSDVFKKRLLGDYLRKADMMSMINSLEYRVPLLDEDFVSYSLGIPQSIKMSGGKGKSLLRNIHSTIYPSYTSTLPKQGFSIPLDTWLSAMEFKEIENYILRGSFVMEFVNADYVKAICALVRGNNRVSEISRAGIYQQVLIFYALELWYSEGRHQGDRY